jgi:hypothetical protein
MQSENKGNFHETDWLQVYELDQYPVEMCMFISQVQQLEENTETKWHTCSPRGEEEIFTDLKNHSDPYNRQEDIVLIYALKHVQLLRSSCINLIENLQKMGI